MHRFGRPPALDEARGEIVEQFRMAGAFAHASEVARRVYDAAAEVVQPNAVDHDPRGERIVVTCDGLGQVEPAASGLEWFTAENGEKPPRDLGAKIVLAAANVDVLVLGVFLIVNDVKKRILFGERVGESIDLRPETIGVTAQCG